MRISLGDFVVDAATRQILRGQVPVHLSPKAFDLLMKLLAERPRAVRKAELQDHLWPDTFVSEANLPMLVGEIRLALGDSRSTPTFIRTVPRFGYLTAARAALDDMEFVARSYAENLQGLRHLEEGSSALGLDYIPSHGNFLTIKVGKAGDIYKRLLRRGVIVRPVGGGYGLPEHLRVTIGTAEENERFLSALAASLKDSLRQ
jgi:DNA-binding winged helix-turn-helix (wHTH) protein